MVRYVRGRKILGKRQAMGKPNHGYKSGESDYAGMSRRVVAFGDQVYVAAGELGLRVFSVEHQIVRLKSQHEEGKHARTMLGDALYSWEYRVVR